MKRYILVIILSLCCASLFSIEFADLRVHLGMPRDIPSNGTGRFELRISNRGDTALHNLELAARHDDDLLVVFRQPKINTLEPGETVRVIMEISSNHSHFFDRNTFVALTVANESYESNFHFRFTIRSVENFWSLVILSLAAVVMFLFIIVYIKTNKGEKNAG